jgi:hypothetical protein
MTKYSLCISSSFHFHNWQFLLLNFILYFYPDVPPKGRDNLSEKIKTNGFDSDLLANLFPYQVACMGSGSFGSLLTYNQHPHQHSIIIIMSAKKFYSHEGFLFQFNVNSLAITNLGPTYVPCRWSFILILYSISSSPWTNKHFKEIPISLNWMLTNDT